MSDTGKQATSAHAGGEVYSKDYWDNVFEQVGRRPLVKLAIAMLALLYATAIYAPLVANDRPYFIESIDTKDYERAVKTLYAGTVSLRGKARTTEAEFLEKLSADAAIRTYAAAIANELDAVVRNVGIMRASLPESDHAVLDDVEARARKVADEALAGRNAEAGELADALKDDAKELRKTFALADPDDPEAEGKRLEPQRSWPLMEAISPVEVFFMWLWLTILLWPLWNPLVNKRLLRGNRNSIRRARKVKRNVVLGSSLVAAVVWTVTVGGHTTFDSADYKQRITAGDMVVREVVWAPLTMGFAETNVSETFRQPTWTDESEIDDEGYYVRGARAIRVDEQSGLTRVAQPVEVREGEPARNSGARHVMGTDSNGRDILARILYGGRISLAVGILSTVLLVFLGVVIGAVAGYFGGWVDILISRLIEVFQSIPAFFLILTAVTMIPDEEIHPIFAIVIFIAVVRWTGVARLVRAEFYKLKEQEFTIAARALGFSSRRVIFGHVLPNALGPVLVAAAFSVAAGILTESAISFLGLGVKVPIPSWGSLLSEARGSTEYWWINVFPGLLIFVTVFCYNVVGEGVRDALDPRRKV